MSVEQKIPSQLPLLHQDSPLAPPLRPGGSAKDSVAEKGGWGDLPRSIAHVLARRGFDTPEKIEALLNPSLSHLESPHAFADMPIAVSRLLEAVQAEQPIAIYADRDVDGLSGLAVLVRSLRSLGGRVIWGSPVKGRGLERAVLEKLIHSGAKVMVLVDCGTGEHAELAWLKSQGIDVIVADHHRFGASRPEAFAWIHPGTLEHGGDPAGCVMAFKLAHAIWISFLGESDPDRMDYFLFSQLDLVAMGLLADRMPLRGENRILVWHGLWRLANSRKVGLSALTRFFRLTPRSGPLSVREVTWQLIPMLNAGGRLGRPEVTAEFLLTEDADSARACIDDLLELNSQRREAQDVSLASFEKAVLEQCAVETDAVLVALAQDVEPSVTGLAAQSLVRKYGRPTFLFVNQGAESVGSGRGTPGFDLFAWVEAQQESVVKFGGHQGAVGLTIRTADFEQFREKLLATAREATASLDPSAGIINHADVSGQVEAHVTLEELDAAWWKALSLLAPFGTGHPMPLFGVDKIDSILPPPRRRSKGPLQDVLLRSGAVELKAQIDWDCMTASGRAALEQIQAGAGQGPWTVKGYPVPGKRRQPDFIWMIRDIGRSDG
jgi:single-stranded-DNA-specific exonuclease